MLYFLDYLKIGGQDFRYQMSGRHAFSHQPTRHSESADEETGRK